MATRRSMLLGIGAAGLTLAACSSSRGARPGGSVARNPNSFSRGMELKQSGDLDEAIRYFAQVAGMGAGYEIAQFQLGDSFLRQAASASDPRQASQKAREGAFWVLIAAQSGNVGAQAKMAKLYFDGTGVARDTAEAGMYVLLAEDNVHADFITNAAKDGIAAIRAGLSPDDWVVARERAAGFEVLEQTTRNFPAAQRPQREREPYVPSGGRRDREGG